VVRGAAPFRAWARLGLALGSGTQESRRSRQRSPRSRAGEQKGVVEPPQAGHPADRCRAREHTRGSRGRRPGRRWCRRRGSACPAALNNWGTQPERPRPNSAQPARASRSTARGDDCDSDGAVACAVSESHGRRSEPRENAIGETRPVSSRCEGAVGERAVPPVHRVCLQVQGAPVVGRLPSHSMHISARTARIPDAGGRGARLRRLVAGAAGGGESDAAGDREVGVVARQAAAGSRGSQCPRLRRRRASWRNPYRRSWPSLRRAPR